MASAQKIYSRLSPQSTFPFNILTRPNIFLQACSLQQHWRNHIVLQCSCSSGKDGQNLGISSLLSRPILVTCRGLWMAERTARPKLFKNARFFSCYSHGWRVWVQMYEDQWLCCNSVKELVHVQIGGDSHTGCRVYLTWLTRDCFLFLTEASNCFPLLNFEQIWILLLGN